jgi:SpoVK/Ycf46/Vps4 family AAA+-type ATPase
VSDDVVSSLFAAIDASPNDLPLRLHLAALLASRGDVPGAIRQAAFVLHADPTNTEALEIIGTSSSEPTISSARPLPPEQRSGAKTEEELLAQMAVDLEGVLPPAFVDGHDQIHDIVEVESAEIRFADVGGMTEVKERLEAAFLVPLRNPELIKLYGKSLRGGLLLYGPPGCGKTYIARAVAGEMGANFIAVSLSEILDSFVGANERNIHEIFEVARRNAPCILFFDEVDALGQKRSNLRSSILRGTTTQLLSEMDGMGNSNEGVYILGATNHPWDIDVALRRPGRFDRTVLVLPPDVEGRKIILKNHLEQRPIANIDLGTLALQTEGYSGADLAYVCETAAERALLESARSGSVRMIEMSDLEFAVRDVRPSTGPWFDIARNVTQFSNSDGTYDDLLTYLRAKGMA